MSVVTGVMLICRFERDDEPDSPIAEIKAWLAVHEYSPGAWALSEIADHAGGFKHPQFRAWSGGFNYFDEDEFAAFVMSRWWTFPEGVVLVMQPEDGETRVFRPKDHAVISVAEEPAAPPMKSVGPGAPIPESWSRMRR